MMGWVYEMSKIKLGTFIALGETRGTLFKPLSKRRRDHEHPIFITLPCPLEGKLSR